MDQFNEETNEAHDAETNSGGNGNLLELFAIGFGATFHQTDGVLGEDTTGFTEFNNFVHGGRGVKAFLGCKTKKYEK